MTVQGKIKRNGMPGGQLWRVSRCCRALRIRHFSNNKIVTFPLWALLGEIPLEYIKKTASIMYALKIQSFSKHNFNSFYIIICFNLEHNSSNSRKTQKNCIEFRIWNPDIMKLYNILDKKKLQYWTTYKTKEVHCSSTQGTFTG